MDRDHSSETSFEKRARASLEAIESRDARAIAALIGWLRSPGEAWQGELCGLLLRGGHGDQGFVPDNPWGVAADEPLVDALRRVWHNASRPCPGFVDTLIRETLGLALVQEADQYLLGYLYLERLGSPHASPADLDGLSQLHHGWIDAIWGGPPVHHPADAPVGALDHPVPALIRDLARIHSWLIGREASIDLASFRSTLGGLLREQDAWEERWDADQIRAGVLDRYVHLAYWPPGASSDYLNLDALDASGDPRVAMYAGEDHCIYDSGPFVDWFDQQACAYLFNCDDD